MASVYSGICWIVSGTLQVFPRMLTNGGRGIFNNRLLYSLLFSGNFFAGGTKS